MSQLEMPVKITITVQTGDGTVRERVLVPGINLTDDGVEEDVDSMDLNNGYGKIATLTRHEISWTEISYGKAAFLNAEGPR